MQTDAQPEEGWTRRQHAWAWAGVLALYVALASYGFTRIPLLDPDEPRYATAGRNMSEGGSWLIPEFNEKPRYNKPPLFYWMVALSHKVLGPSEISARMPSIVMGLVMLVLTVWVGRRMYDPSTAYMAGLILCTTPLFMGLSRTCVIDMTLSTILSAGLFLMLLRLTGCLRRDPMLLVGICMGLAFMAKGPAAALIVVVPLLFVVFFAHKGFFKTPGPLWAANWLVVAALGFGWYAVAGSGGKLPPFALAGLVMAALTVLFYGLRRMFTFPIWLLALLIAVGLSVWWYLALWGYIGSEKFSELLRFEILGRLEGKVHNEPPAFYFYILPAVFFPWSIALIGALASACRRIEIPLPLSGDHDRTTVRNRRQVSDAFLVAWVAGVVIFFSVPAAKLATYVLPAIPAAALLTARFLARIRSREEPIDRTWLGVTAGLGGVVAVALAVVPYMRGLLKDDATQVVQQLPVPFALVGLLLGLLTGGAWVVSMLTRRARVALVTEACFVVLLVAVALPTVMSRAEFLNTTRNLSRQPEVAALARKADAVHTAGWEEEALVWYLGRGVHEVSKPIVGGSETRASLIQEAFDEYPPGRVIIFAHRRKLREWFGGGWPERVREVAGNPYVAVLVNEAAPPEKAPER